MKNIVDEDKQYSHIPDYSVDLTEDDMVVFRSRGTVPAIACSERVDASLLRISGDGYEEARLAAPGWDIHVIEQEWREWITEPPRNADAAFVGFCRKWFEKRGYPS